MAGFFERLTEGLFFQTDKRPYWDHTHFGVPGEHVRLAGPNDSEIAGIFMPAIFAPDATSNRPRGTVLFAHACLHNMQFHLPQVIWLVAAGFNVMTYDPRGCGKTAGSIDLASIGEDICAAWTYLQSRDEVEPERIIVFGQNAGAYAALELLKEKRGVAGVVLESIWATQTGYLLDRYGPGIGHLLKALCPKRSDPIDVLGSIDIPVALAVGSRDASIPDAEVRRVMKALPKHREIWFEEGARHLEIFPRPTSARERFLAFAQNTLNK